MFNSSLALRQTEVFFWASSAFYFETKEMKIQDHSAVLPYEVYSLGEKHATLELDLQKLHRRSGKSQNHYYVHDQPLKYWAQGSDSLLWLLSIFWNKYSRASIPLVGEGKRAAYKGECCTENETGEFRGKNKMVQIWRRTEAMCLFRKLCYLLIMYIIYKGKPWKVKGCMYFKTDHNEVAESAGRIPILKCALIF